MNARKTRYDPSQLPKRTRPNLEKLLRGLCRFEKGDGNPCAWSRDGLSADLSTDEGHALAEKLVALAQMCAKDFRGAAMASGASRHNENLRDASMLWLVAWSLETVTETVPEEVKQGRSLDSDDIAYCCPHVVRTIIDVNELLELDEFDDELEDAAETAA